MKRLFLRWAVAILAASAPAVAVPPPPLELVVLGVAQDAGYPLVVPHRDEFSETAAFSIEGAGRRVLFVPDIDKWEKWQRRIEDEVAKVDLAFLDATFYAEGELPGRNMAEIPHPFVVETLRRFDPLPASLRGKIHFLHMNHSNPLLIRPELRAELRAKGYQVAAEGDVHSLELPD